MNTTTIEQQQSGIALNVEMSKTSIARAAADDRERIIETGGDTVIRAAEFISAVELYAKEFKNDKFVDATRDALSMHQKSVATVGAGTKIEACEAGTKYDYLSTGDPIIADLVKQSDALKEKIKERETFLKTIPADGLEIIADGGEVVKLMPPLKTSTSTYKVTLAK